MKSKIIYKIVLFTSFVCGSQIQAIDFKYDIPDMGFSGTKLSWRLGYGINQRSFSGVHLYTKPADSFSMGTLVSESANYQSTMHQVGFGMSVYGHAAFYGFWLGYDMDMYFPVGYLKQSINGEVVTGNDTLLPFGVRFGQMAGYNLGPVRVFGLLGGGFEFLGAPTSSGGLGNPIKIGGVDYEISSMPGFNFFAYTGGGIALKLWNIILRSDMQITFFNSDSHINSQTVYSFSAGNAF